jgi:outer membrane protein OmpA-like peptidoglycan-associated protein
MRYPILYCAFTALLGSAIAYADETPKDPDVPQDQATDTSGAKDMTGAKRDTTKTDRTKTDRTQAKIEKTQAKNERAQAESAGANVDLFFATDSSQLAATSDTDLKPLADFASCDPNHALILEGYADPRGTKDHNLKLSGSRAAEVRQKLIDMGVPSRRIVVTLYGENGKRRSSFAEDRRVSVRAEQAPIAPEQLSSR